MSTNGETPEKWIRNLVQQACYSSCSNTQRKLAVEAELLETHASYIPVLWGCITRHHPDANPCDNMRLMAAILLRKCIKRFAKGEISIDENVVCSLCGELMSYIELRDHNLEKQLSSILSLLALKCWPKHWPTFVPAFIQILSSTQDAGRGNFHTVHVMRRLHESLGQLSTRLHCVNFTPMFAELCWTLFPSVMKIWVPTVRDAHAGLSRYPLTGSVQLEEAAFDRDEQLEIQLFLAACTSKTLSLVIQAGLPLIAARNACFRNFWKTYVSVIAPLSERVRRARTLYSTLFLSDQNPLADANNLKNADLNNEKMLQMWIFHQDDELNPCLDWVEELQTDCLSPTFKYSGFYAQCHLLQGLTKALTCTPVMAQRRFPQLMQPLIEPLLGFYSHHLLADFPVDRPDLRRLAQSVLPLRRLAFASMSLMATVIQRVLRDEQGDSSEIVNDSDNQQQMNQDQDDEHHHCGPIVKLQQHPLFNCSKLGSAEVSEVVLPPAQLVQLFFTDSRVTQLLELLCLAVLCWTQTEISSWKEDPEAFFAIQLQDNDEFSLRTAGERLFFALLELRPDCVANWLRDKLCDTTMQSTLLQPIMKLNDDESCNEFEDKLLYWDGIYHCASLCATQLTERAHFSLSDWCNAVLGPMFAALEDNTMDAQRINMYCRKGCLRGGQQVLTVRLLQLLGRWTQSHLLQPHMLPGIVSFITNCLFCPVESFHMNDEVDLVQKLYTARALESILQSSEASMAITIYPENAQKLCMGIMQVTVMVQDDLEIRRWLLGDTLLLSLLDIAQCSVSYSQQKNYQNSQTDQQYVNLLDLIQSTISSLSPFSFTQIQHMSQIIVNSDAHDKLGTITFQQALQVAGSGNKYNIFVPILCEVLQKMLHSLSVQPQNGLAEVGSYEVIGGLLLGLLMMGEISVSNNNTHVAVFEEAVLMYMTMLRSPLLQWSSGGSLHNRNLILGSARLSYRWLHKLLARSSEVCVNSSILVNMVHSVELLILTIHDHIQYDKNAENNYVLFVAYSELLQLLQDPLCGLLSWVQLNNHNGGISVGQENVTAVRQISFRLLSSIVRYSELSIAVCGAALSEFGNWCSNECVSRLLLVVCNNVSCPNLTAVCRAMHNAKANQDWSEVEVWAILDLLATIINNTKLTLWQKAWNMSLTTACKEISLYLTQSHGILSSSETELVHPVLLLGQLLLCYSDVLNRTVILSGCGGLLWRHRLWLQAMWHICHTNEVMSNESKEWKFTTLRDTAAFLRATLSELRQLSITERAALLSQVIAEDICTPADLSKPTAFAYHSLPLRQALDEVTVSQVTKGIVEWEWLLCEITSMSLSRATFVVHHWSRGDSEVAELQLAEQAVGLAHRRLFFTQQQAALDSQETFIDMIGSLWTQSATL